MRMHEKVWWSVVAAVVGAVLLAAAPAAARCGGDRDRDGLTNCGEKRLGTNPRNADTDHDGLADGF